MKIKIVTPQHSNAVSWTAALRESDESFDVCSELRPLHTVLAYLLFATFLVHLGAALTHALIFRDGVFQSMTFRRR